MIKVLNQYIPSRLLILLASETLLILLIWAAVAFEYGVLDVNNYTALLLKSLVATVICQLCLYYADIYNLRAVGSRSEVFFRLIQALGAASLLLPLVFLLFPDGGLNDRVVLTAIVATVIVLLAWRLTADRFSRTYGTSERILLVGSSCALNQLVSEVEDRPYLPIRFIGVVVENENGRPLPDMRKLGTISQLESIITETSPDRVILALEERRQTLPINMLLKKRMQGLRVEEATILYQKITGKIPVESISPSSLIFADGFVQSRFRKTYSSVLSMVAALGGLILFGPLMLLVCLLIKLDSKGPVLYGQTRIGKYGRPFEILKFRTMYVGAEEKSGPVWASEKDPRITRAGRILRALRIDELPQFLNLLAGDMALVGPRPERPHFVDQLTEKVPFYELRHTVRPGLTGWAQVRLAYTSTMEDARVKLEYDLFYIKNASFWLDMMIIFRTIKIVLFRRGAR